MTPNIWNNTYTLFLFDRQLIYCKKDLLKRTHHIYKGRIFLDNCRILNLPDGKIFGVTLRNALRIYCDTRNKWLDFCFRSSRSKLCFLNTLSAERQFCGQSLFVSELANVDDDTMSDREYSTGIETPSEVLHVTERGIDIANLDDELVACDAAYDAAYDAKEKYKKSNTLPKKSRKQMKENMHTGIEYNSHSLGRTRIGNWFRKAKSTNSTPSQSPIHQPPVIPMHSNSSSSQSSPALGSRPTNFAKAVTIKDGPDLTS